MRKLPGATPRTPRKRRAAPRRTEVRKWRMLARRASRKARKRPNRAPERSKTRPSRSGGEMATMALEYLPRPVRRLWRRNERSAWKGLLAGAAGGLVGTIVMTQFQNGWQKGGGKRRVGGPRKKGNRGGGGGAEGKGKKDKK